MTRREIDSSARDALRFRVQERVRWSDVDASGNILWSAYTRFVELAETEFAQSVRNEGVAQSGNPEDAFAELRRMRAERMRRTHQDRAVVASIEDRIRRTQRDFADREVLRGHCRDSAVPDRV